MNGIVGGIKYVWTIMKILIHKKILKVSIIQKKFENTVNGAIWKC
jgi:hypothetical protein